MRNLAKRILIIWLILFITFVEGGVNSNKDLIGQTIPPATSTPSHGANQPNPTQPAHHVDTTSVNPDSPPALGRSISNGLDVPLIVQEFIANQPARNNTISSPSSMLATHPLSSRVTTLPDVVDDIVVDDSTGQTHGQGAPKPSKKRARTRKANAKARKRASDALGAFQKAAAKAKKRAATKVTKPFVGYKPLRPRFIAALNNRARAKLKTSTPYGKDKVPTRDAAKRVCCCWLGG